MEETAADKEIYFVADPMCSWCWGFAPVIKAIAARWGGLVPVSLIVGGLRPGATEAMDEAMKSYIRHHWREVEKKTGQPFRYDFFENDGFVYDTEPACRAAVAMRRLSPASALPYFEALQSAFYAENRDITQAPVLGELAVPFGIEPDIFQEAFSSPETHKATRNDFTRAREMGVTGFPALIARDGEQYGFLTLGYRPLDSITPLLNDWLNAT